MLHPLYYETFLPRAVTLTVRFRGSVLVAKELTKEALLTLTKYLMSAKNPLMNQVRPAEQDIKKAASQLRRPVNQNYKSFTLSA